MTKKELDAVYAHHCPKCGEAKPKAAGSAFNLDELLGRAIKAVHKGNADAVMAGLSKAYAARIGSGVQDGYSKKPFEVAWDSPDGEMIRHLQANVYEFSFAKSYQQLRALTSALYDKEGHIVPFHEFREVAVRINNELSVRHLETEYNTAIGSAQMAGRWVQYEADKDQFPMLTYQTVGDGRVRPTHAALDNVTRPIDDPFWSKYYTPNGWGCRCDVIQAIGRRATPVEKIAIPEDVPALFQTNLAKSRLVFPAGHPYFNELPAEVTRAANGSNPFSYEKVWNGQKGGYVYENPVHNTTTEEKELAMILADKGHRVIMLPEVPADTEAQRTLRELCLPEGIKAGKTPDARVNDQLMEFKTNRAGTANSIDAALREANGKADKINVCIRLTKAIHGRTLNKAIRDRMARAENIQEVWIIDLKDKIKKHSRAKLTKK